MLRKYVLYAAAGLLACVLIFLGGYYWRPILLSDGGETMRVRPGSLTVGQALLSARASLTPQDQVEPGLDAWIPLNRQISIRRAVYALVWEDGQARSLSGFETSAPALLEQNGLTLGPQDHLLWNGQPVTAETVLPTGQPVVLQVVRSKTFVLDDNGQRREVATGAPNTARALWESGVRLGPGDRLSVSTASPLETGAVIAYQQARSLQIEAAGQQIHARTAADSVGEALAEAGIALVGLDYSHPAEDQPLPADGQVRVVRVREEITLKETLVPYETEYQPDPELELDGRRTLQDGQYGVKVERERARFEDGQEVSREFDSDWTASEPVAQTIGMGTKVVPKTVNTPDGNIEYWREVRVYATSYSPCQQGIGHCSFGTSSGIKLTKGVVAVTLNWYRQLAGQRVYIPGYGFGVIGDVGGGIPGTPWIDLGWDEENFQGMVGWMTMYLLSPAPPNVSWNFP